MPSRRSQEQSQESGSQSTNIQAQGNINYHHGLSYADTKEVVQDACKAEFVKLRAEAAEIAEQRAEALIDSFIDELKHRGLNNVPEGGNPDFQLALYSAQRDYARTGDEDLGELLVQLLADRAEVSERNLTQIVLNESLEVARKLTLGQMAALSTIFLARHSVNNGVTDIASLVSWIKKSVGGFMLQASRDDVSYQHLEYAGCGSVSIGQVKLEKAIREAYPGLFCSGFTQEELQDTGLSLEDREILTKPNIHDDTVLQMAATTDQQADLIGQRHSLVQEKVEKVKKLHNSKLVSPERVKEHLLEVDSSLENTMFEVWNNTLMKNVGLTSVGLAIAHANVKKRAGDFADLSIWIS